MSHEDLFMEHAVVVIAVHDDECNFLKCYLKVKKKKKHNA